LWRGGAFSTLKHYLLPPFRGESSFQGLLSSSRFPPPQRPGNAKNAWGLPRSFAGFTKEGEGIPKVFKRKKCSAEKKVPNSLMQKGKTRLSLQKKKGKGFHLCDQTSVPNRKKGNPFLCGGKKEQQVFRKVIPLST